MSFSPRRGSESRHSLSLCLPTLSPPPEREYHPPGYNGKEPSPPKPSCRSSSVIRSRLSETPGGGGRAAPRLVTPRAIKALGLYRSSRDKQRANDVTWPRSPEQKKLEVDVVAGCFGLLYAIMPCHGVDLVDLSICQPLPAVPLLQAVTPHRARLPARLSCLTVSVTATLSLMTLPVNGRVTTRGSPRSRLQILIPEYFAAGALSGWVGNLNM